VLNTTLFWCGEAANTDNNHPQARLGV